MTERARAEARRMLTLMTTLGVTSFKLRYYGNALGYFWTLAKPLMIFAVIYVAFTEILQIGDAVPYYPQMLITGLVFYNFFAESTSTAVGSLVEAGGLIRKIPVPALAVPLSAVLRTFFTLCLNLIAVLVFYVLGGIEVTTGWLLFPVLLAAMLVFTIAVSALLASLYVPFRDTGQIWDVGLQLMFWGSPIIYPVETVSGGLQDAIMLNPLAVIVVELRHSMIDPSAPSAAEVAGAGHVAIAALIGVAILSLSVWLYRRTAPRLAEQI